MRGVAWFGAAAAVLAWIGGTHTLAAGGALLLMGALALHLGSRPTRLLMAAVAPLLLFVFNNVEGMGDVRVFAALPAAALCWVPLLRELGGDVPRQIWILPVVLLLLLPLLVGSWSTVLVASDIAVRAQVLVIGALALLVWSLSPRVR